jgi:hypothetical protein
MDYAPGFFGGLGAFGGGGAVHVLPILFPRFVGVNDRHGGRDLNP